MRNQPKADATGLIFNFAIVSLSWLLTALARLKADDYRQMRHMYIRRPRGWADGGSCRSTGVPGVLPLPAARQAGSVGQDEKPVARQTSRSVPSGI